MCPTENGLRIVDEKAFVQTHLRQMMRTNKVGTNQATKEATAPEVTERRTATNLRTDLQITDPTVQMTKGPLATATPSTLHINALEVEVALHDLLPETQGVR